MVKPTKHKPKNAELIEKNEDIKVNPRLYDYALVLGLFLLAMILFKGIFSATNMIVSTDYSLWGPKMYRDTILSGQWQKWISFVLAGIDYQALFIYPNIIFMLLLPLHFFVGFMFALDIFLAGAFMYCLLKYLKMDRFPAVLGALGFMFTTHLVSQVYPGHLGKLDMFTWTPLVFLFYTRGFKENKWIWFIIAGLFYGLQFLAGEVQIAFYVGICLAFYTVYLLVQKYLAGDKDWKSYTQNLAGGLLMIFVTVLLASQVFVYYLGLSGAGQGEAAGTTADNPASQYEFATSWSFPPEEIITLVMQRPFGNISGDGYWGRLGSKNSPLKLNDDYIGVLPFLLALTGLFFVPKRKTIFWGLLAICTIVLAFGGFTPIYKFVYLLPAMKSFRAPTKWTFLFVFAMSILAAYGANYLYRRDENKADKKLKIWQWFLIGCSIGGLLLGLSGEIFRESILTSINNTLQNRGSSLDYSIIYGRYQGVLSSLWKMNIFLWISSGLIIFALKAKQWSRSRNYLFACLGLLLIIELWMSGSYFIQYFPYQDYYTKHPVTQFILDDPEIPRVKMGPQNGMLNNLATMQFKYYQILCWDTPASRLPVHYKHFMETVGKKDVFKFFDIVSIKYFLSAQPMSDPSFQEVFQNSGIYVYQYINYLPHIYTIGHYQVASKDEDALKTIALPEFNPRNTVLLNEDPGVPNPAIAPYDKNGLKFNSYTNNVIEISANAPQDTFLVLTDYYFPNWHAFIDGKETKIFRANYLDRAIRLPKGEHQVKFVFSPPMTWFYVSLLSWLVVLSGIVLFFIRNRKKENA